LTDGKAVSDPVGLGSAVDPEKLSHAVTPVHFVSKRLMGEM
jgi:hypothetical protein